MKTIRLIPVLVLCVTLTAGCSLGKPAAAKRQDGTAAPSGNDQDPVAAETGESSLPTPDQATETAPETFRARFKTTKGDFVVEVTREWAPNGADRFYNLVKLGYFKDISIFRAIEGFMFQFGIHGDPEMNKAWGESTIKDDPYNDQSNKPGYLTFARTGRPDSRGSQLFINLGDNSFLDHQGFTPIGQVVEGMEIASEINTEYGENSGEVQGRLTEEGNAFIKEKYPNIDYITEIVIDDPNAAASEAAPVDPASGDPAPAGDGGGSATPAGDGGGN
jgi:peptidyl-prolyl cis-trans isomerase A (cyclophilin A)